jgi:hypothetical protein
MQRTEKEINEGMRIFYTPTNRIIMVQDNYDHSLQRILSSMKYIRKLVSIPSLDKINIEVLDRPRFKSCMSIEFTSTNDIPKECKQSDQFILLEEDSNLWNWLNKC